MKQSTEFLKRHALVIGISLMFLLTWPIDLSNSGVLSIQFPFIVYLFLGWGFVFASIIMTWLTLGKDGVVRLLKRYLQGRVSWKWYLAAFLLEPVCVVLGVYTNAALTGIAPDFNYVMAREIFGEAARLWLYVLPFFLIDFIANGEEIGWRGYVLPRLQSKYNALISTLILGLLWGFWHLPKFLSHWNTVSFAWFILHSMAFAVTLTWLYNGTKGSLLLVTIMHASANTAGIFFPMANTVSNENMGAYIGYILFEVIAALIIIVVTGPENLSRTEPKQIQELKNKVKTQTRFQKLLNFVKRGTLGTIAVILLLAITGTIYQTAASEADKRNFPAPGNLIDVDGYKMHIYCLGEGSPTIILDHVGGGSSVDWALIQPKLAEHTRVCAYDRAGYGWSEYNPAPRTLAEQALELHTLLVNANEQGPYLLVGHSYGARVARVFAARYPTEMVGMALMDPGVLYDDPRYPQETLDELESENRTIRIVRMLVPFGVVRILRPVMSSPTYDLPENARLANMYFGSSEKFWESLVDQTDILPSIYAEERSVTTLGDMPLLMLISGEPNDPEHQVYTQANIEMSGLSTHGRYQIVAGATHMSLAFRKEDAQVCTNGILSILDDVRSKHAQ